MFPLYTGLASTAHAEATTDALQNSLLRAGGLAATQIGNGPQWDEPNGWAPLPWVAVAGLSRYQENGLAAQIGTRFLHQVQDLYGA